MLHSYFVFCSIQWLLSCSSHLEIFRQKTKQWKQCLLNFNFIELFWGKNFSYDGALKTELEIKQSLTLSLCSLCRISTWVKECEKINLIWLNKTRTVEWHFCLAWALYRPKKCLKWNSTQNTTRSYKEFFCDFCQPNNKLV